MHQLWCFQVVMVELVEEMLITLVVKLTLVMEITKIATLMEPAPTVLIMLVVKPKTEVVSLINLDVILSAMFVLVVHPMMTAQLIKPIAMLMALAKIADYKAPTPEIAVLVGLSLMVLLALLPLTETVTPYMVSVWIFVFKTLTAQLPVLQDANLSVVAVLSAQLILTVPFHNGEELREHSRPCVTREWDTNVFTLLPVHGILTALALPLPVHSLKTNVLNAVLIPIVPRMSIPPWPVM